MRWFRNVRRRPTTVPIKSVKFVVNGITRNRTQNKHGSGKLKKIFEVANITKERELN